MSEEFGPYDQPVQVDPAPSVADNSISSVGGGNEFGPTPEQTIADRKASIDAAVANSGDTTFSAKALTDNTAKNAAINDAVANSGDTTFSPKALTSAGTSGSTNSTAGQRDSNTADSSGTTGGNAGDKITAAQTSKPADNSFFSSISNGLVNGLVGGVAQAIMMPGAGGAGIPNYNTVNILNQGVATTVGSGIGTSTSGNNGGGTTGSNGTGPVGNILHNYTNVSYRLSIWAVPKEAINQIYDNAIRAGSARSILKGGECIIADSGINSSERSKDFPTDMSINNVEFTTSVGHGAETRGTDVISFKFNIIEPYTANLFARMRKLCARMNPQGGWNTMFFVFRIQWFGYNDSGQPVTIPVEKFIPFQFVNINLSITAAGAMYDCEATAVSSIGASIIDNTVPFHVELTGGTIGDLFNAGSISYSSSGTANSSTNPDRAAGAGTGSASSSPVPPAVTKGLAEALNANEKEKCKAENKGQLKPNVYEFYFDSAISNAIIGDPQKFKEQSLAMSSGSGNDQKNAVQQGKFGQLTLDPKNNVFRAQSGTKISDLIGSVITVSNYMTGQYNKSGAATNAPIRMWKVLPTVKFGEIDFTTNYYQRTVRFNVIAYDIKGQDAMGFGNAVPDDSEVVKKYNYIFTGKNKDVISVDLNYQMAFTEMRNGTIANLVNKANDSPGPVTDTESGHYQPTNTGGFKPRVAYVNGLANRQNSGDTSETYASVEVQNLMNKLLDNDYDLITLDINIVGDPDWLSQDYPLYGPTVGTGVKLQDGSINFTRQQLFDFYFASPGTDYDDSTGLFGVDSNYAEFSGRYQVISVVSSFVNGNFTQKVSASRLRNQNPVASGTARADQIGGSTSIGSTSGSSSSSIYNAGSAILPGYGGGISGRNILMAGVVGAAAGAIGAAAGGLVNGLFSKSPATGKSGSVADSIITAPNTDTNSKTDPDTGAAVPSSSAKPSAPLPPVRPNDVAAQSGSSNTNNDRLAGDGSGSVSADLNTRQQAVNDANNINGSTLANPDRYVEPTTTVPADTGIDPYALGGSGTGSNSGISEDQAYPI